MHNALESSSRINIRRSTKAFSDPSLFILVKFPGFLNLVEKISKPACLDGQPGSKIGNLQAPKGLLAFKWPKRSQKNSPRHNAIVELTGA